MKTRYISIILTGLALAGCASSNTQKEWSCSAIATGGCTSIAQNDEVALLDLKSEDETSEIDFLNIDHPEMGLTKVHLNKRVTGSGEEEIVYVRQE